jgi:iron complex outermembrane recepter protein
VSVLKYLAASIAAIFTSMAIAQQDIEIVEVVETTPLGGSVNIDQVAANVQVATFEEMGEQRAIDLAEFMNRQFGSVFVNDAQSNPLLSDLQYRGYVGSPLLGLPQGIAVYQDGVRINEPFGDTVNWALIPDSAIDSVYLMPGANPLYGLNALGGAISIKTKSGSTNPGTAVDLYAGSFSRARLTLETGGVMNKKLSYFVTASYLAEDGWRDFSPSDASQLFGKLSWQFAQSSLDVSLTHADTNLIGNGAAPIELLNRSREAVFTRPDQTRNELLLLNILGSHRVSDNLSLTGNVYVRDSDIHSVNGDDSDLDECRDIPGFVCAEHDSGQDLVRDQHGNRIPSAMGIGSAALNRTGTTQDGAGLGFQASWASELVGRENFFVLGLAYDESDIDFQANTEVSALDATRQAIPSGYLLDSSFTLLNSSVINTGFYVSNVTALSESVSFTVSGRYNRTEVALRDRLGTALNGNHVFRRFNPAVGITVNLSKGVSAYAGYTESNRAPSPVELTCADEDDPCRLPNAFLSDPPLKDVVAQTIEAGVRGVRDEIQWHAGLFRATNIDDILFISAGPFTNEGFFENVGRTKRDGLELSVNGAIGERVTWFANYSYLKATFRERFAVVSPNNPESIDDELIVEPGDHLPLIPSQLFKAGFRFKVTPKATVGVDFLARSDSFYRGDESNVADKIGSFAVANLRAEYTISENLQLYMNINNLLDSDYETFGLFGDATDVLGDDFGDSRFLSPGAHRAAWFGVRSNF